LATGDRAKIIRAEKIWKRIKKTRARETVNEITQRESYRRGGKSRVDHKLRCLNKWGASGRSNPTWYSTGGKRLRAAGGSSLTKTSKSGVWSITRKKGLHPRRKGKTTSKRCLGLWEGAGGPDIK